MHITQWFGDLHDDFLVAIRRLKQSPGFTAAAVVTLALGIGANSALFALADATLLRPLPFADADRVIMLHERTPAAERGIVAPFEGAAWSDRNRTFEALAGISDTKRAMTSSDGLGEQIDTQTVSVQFFDVFQVPPIAGRTFAAADDRLNSDAVVVGDRLWKGRFGGDRGFVGRRIRIDGEPFTVVGIMPDRFQVLSPSDAWTILPTVFMRSPGGVSHYLRVVGQIAAAVVLLCSAGLLARSLAALGRVDSGSRASEVLTMTIGLPFVRPDAVIRKKW